MRIPADENIGLKSAFQSEPAGFAQPAGSITKILFCYFYQSFYPLNLLALYQF